MNAQPSDGLERLINQLADGTLSESDEKQLAETLRSDRPGDIVYLMWFNTGEVDRGLVIDRIWVDRSEEVSGQSP